MATESVVSTSAMPAVNRAGKIMIVPEIHPSRRLRRRDAEEADFGGGIEAEPNRKPIGYICQECDTMPNSGRNSRDSSPRPASSASSSSSPTLAP